MNFWRYIEDQVLGMKWLNRLIGQGLAHLGLDVSGCFGGGVQFFLYDTIKIMLLLGFLILMISYIQSYFPPERTKRILGRFHGIGANCIAALLGTVTPFCSCSSIPLFIGFTSAGLPLGVTFSFLISSPMVDLASLLLLMSIFGWKKSRIPPATAMAAVPPARRRRSSETAIPLRRTVSLAASRCSAPAVKAVMPSLKRHRMQ